MSYSLHRGDDLGELTETQWPELYIPQAGLGDLTGMRFIDVFVCHLFVQLIKHNACIFRHIL